MTKEDVLNKIYGTRNYNELRSYFLSNDNSLKMILDAMQEYAYQEKEIEAVAFGIWIQCEILSNNLIKGLGRGDKDYGIVWFYKSLQHITTTELYKIFNR